MSAKTARNQPVWERIFEEVREMATALREDGWGVCLLRAGHVSAVPPGASADRHGLVYIVPDSVGEELPGLIERSTFDRYEVFREAVAEDLFVVTQLKDVEHSRAVILAGVIDRRGAGDLASAARERGELHSHVRLLDGTHLATFHHEDPTHFFPERR